MNDFNKGELELLSESLHYAEDSPCWHGYVGAGQLKIKLQSMIDNYLEHQICQGIDEDIEALTEQGIYHTGTIDE